MVTVRTLTVAKAGERERERDEQKRGEIRHGQRLETKTLNV